VRHGRTGANRIAAGRLGLGLIEQSLPDDEVCDEVCDEDPATTSTSIENVQTPGPGALTGRQNTDNN